MGKMDFIINVHILPRIGIYWLSNGQMERNVCIFSKIQCIRKVVFLASFLYILKECNKFIKGCQPNRIYYESHCIKEYM